MISSPCANTQAMASCARVAPFSTAICFSASVRTRFAFIVANASGEILWPIDFNFSSCELPPISPERSTPKATMPTPNSLAVGKRSSSICRSANEYLTSTRLIGCTAFALRSISPFTSEIPIFFTYPFVARSDIAPMVSSTGICGLMRAGWYKST